MKSKTNRLEGTQGAPQKLTLKKKKPMIDRTRNKRKKQEDQDGG